jgi:hypothetical protein
MADILSVSVSWLCARCCGLLRSSKPTALSNMRILPMSEIFAFRPWVPTVRPLVIPFLCPRQVAGAKYAMVKTSGESRLVAQKASFGQRLYASDQSLPMTKNVYLTENEECLGRERSGFEEL